MNEPMSNARFNERLSRLAKRLSIVDAPMNLEEFEARIEKLEQWCREQEADPTFLSTEHVVATPMFLSIEPTMAPITVKAGGGEVLTMAEYLKTCYGPFRWCDPDKAELSRGLPRTNCRNCGAPVQKSVCEYCGTVNCTTSRVAVFGEPKTVLL